MQTHLPTALLNTAAGQEVQRILRSCVHCGFCTATCPTYQHLNDERDGPRGRIYLLKQFLEGAEVSEKTRTHLDRCLGCRSCETTCPSGVEYGRLMDIGRHLLEQRLPRSINQRLIRWGIRKIVPYPKRFGALLALGESFKPVLPATLCKKIPAQSPVGSWPKQQHARTMLVLAGCVQSCVTPQTNQQAAVVLNHLGISLKTLPKAGCCGAVSYHLAAHEEGLDFMRRNIDAWWPDIEAGAEAIISTASGCGVMLKDYGKLLKNDQEYAEKAQKVSDLVRDLAEVLLHEDLSLLPVAKQKQSEKIAFHCPCTLQHALKLDGVVEKVLQRVGIHLVMTKDKHLCCGSAGTYSLLQPEISQALLKNKVQALTINQPDRIVTANIGCQLHLASATALPVQHWIELLDPR